MYEKTKVSPNAGTDNESQRCSATGPHVDRSTYQTTGVNQSRMHYRAGYLLLLCSSEAHRRLCTSQLRPLWLSMGFTIAQLSQELFRQLFESRGYTAAHGKPQIMTYVGGGVV